MKKHLSNFASLAFILGFFMFANSASIFAGTVTITYKCNGSSGVCHTFKGSGDIGISIPGTMAPGYPKIEHIGLAQPPVPPGMNVVNNIFLHNPDNPLQGWGYVGVTAYVDQNGNSTGEIYADENVQVITSYSAWRNAVGLPPLP